MFVLAMALAAQDVTEEVRGWTVTTGLEKADCTMSAKLASGGAISFHWRPRKQVGVMVYRAPDFKSVEQGKRYEIEVGFLKGKKLDNGWGKKSATGDVGPDGMQGLMITFSGKEILADLAASNKIGFWYRDKLAGVVPLDGSGKAVAALRRCEAAVLQNPRDVFED
ncbi:MAG: hypothetical protein J7500_12860 [Sphingomonas sp.]|uniref:hypothetical protein n=1 Tax=Sphingomonas sp. TaxID=28214 RepID=UPI001B034C19|nr:hypothetical protein [Sphingomonas sp.]MBO9623592.1 hypothetical protein [Sphingomonas sp.]